MGGMTFGDTVTSSFCIKHKLLMRFKKIIFLFSFEVRGGRTGGAANPDGRAVAFSTHPSIWTDSTSPLPRGPLTKVEPFFFFFCIKNTFT